MTEEKTGRRKFKKPFWKREVSWGTWKIWKELRHQHTIFSDSGLKFTEKRWVQFCVSRETRRHSALQPALWRISNCIVAVVICTNTHMMGNATKESNVRLFFVSWMADIGLPYELPDLIDLQAKQNISMTAYVRANRVEICAPSAFDCLGTPFNGKWYRDSALQRSRCNHRKTLATVIFRVTQNTDKLL